MAFEPFGRIGQQQTAFGQSIASLDIRNQQFQKQFREMLLAAIQDKLFKKFIFEKQQRAKQREEQRANVKTGIGLAISGISAGIGGVPGAGEVPAGIKSTGNLVGGIPGLPGLPGNFPGFSGLNNGSQIPGSLFENQFGRKPF